MSSPEVCFQCRHISGCPESRRLAAEDPQKIHSHGCDEFSGISSGEKQVREDSLNQFGAIAVAMALIDAKEITHVAYSEEDLSKMKRYELRTVAKGLGLPMTESGEKTADELKQFILEKQGGKSSKPAAAKATARSAREEEPEPEKEEASEEEAPLSVAGLMKTVEALGDAMDDKTKRDEECFAVLDRKLNYLLSALMAIGKATINEGYDPLKQPSESFSKTKKFTVKLGAIQEKSPFTEESQGEG